VGFEIHPYHRPSQVAMSIHRDWDYVGRDSYQNSLFSLRTIVGGDLFVLDAFWEGD
jgi:hypothetical protein